MTGLAALFYCPSCMGEEIFMAYRTGMKVMHRVFGMGTVVSVGTDTVRVKFDRLATLRTIRADYRMQAV